MTKNSSTIECSIFVFSYYLLFVIRYLVLFTIPYVLLDAQIIMNKEWRIFNNCVIFLENISNSINHLLTSFLSVLTQYFIFDQYGKLQKSKYQYIFYRFVSLFCLRQEIDKSFSKEHCFQLYGTVYQKFTETKIANNNKL